MTEEAAHTNSHLFSLASFPLLSFCLLCLSHSGLPTLLQTHTGFHLRTFVLPGLCSLAVCLVPPSLPSGLSLSVLFPERPFPATFSFLFSALYFFSVALISNTLSNLSDLVSYLSLLLQYQLHEYRDFCLFCSLWHPQHCAWFTLSLGQ